MSMLPLDERTVTLEALFEATGVPSGAEVVGIDFDESGDLRITYVPPGSERPAEDADERE